MVVAGLGAALALVLRPRSGVTDERIETARTTGREPHYIRTDQIVLVEDHGAVGDGLTNDRAAIQKAIDTAIAANIPTVVFSKRAYAVWHTPRIGNADIHANYYGHGLVVNGSVTLVSDCGRTDLLFRSPRGRSLEEDWQWVAGGVWRGGGIFLRGAATDPGLQHRNALTLRGIYLQGGTSFTVSGGMLEHAPVGDGWDITHKGIWAENDRFVGDIALHDSGVIGFRGESLYQSGTYNGGLILRNVEIAQCNANAINPGGVTFVDIDGLRVHDVYQGFEGWGGSNGRMVNAEFENVHNGAGRLQGGTANLEPGAFFYAPKRIDPAREPTFIVKATYRNCGSVMIGSFLTGHLTLVDTPVFITPIDHGDYVTAVHLTLDVWADRTSFDALTIYGSSPLTHSDIVAIIHTHQTMRARATGASILAPVAGNGPLGRNIRIVDGDGPITTWPVPKPAPHGFTSQQPIYEKNRWQLIGKPGPRG